MYEKVYCIECKKYFKNKEDWQKEHDKISMKIMKVKHNYLIEVNTLGCIFNIMSFNSKIEQTINE